MTTVVRFAMLLRLCMLVAILAAWLPSISGDIGIQHRTTSLAGVLSSMDRPGCNAQASASAAQVGQHVHNLLGDPPSRLQGPLACPVMVPYALPLHIWVGACVQEARVLTPVDGRLNRLGQVRARRHEAHSARVMQCHTSSLICLLHIVKPQMSPSPPG